MSTNEPDPFVALADDPVGNKVHHPYTAYNQGHDAGYLGWPNDAMNPYPADSREHRWWRMGFFDANEQDEDPLERWIEDAYAAEFEISEYEYPDGEP